MAAFRLRNDAKKWFKNLRDPGGGFSLDFDSFYICFLVGVLTRTKKENVSTADSSELVDYFPDRYRERGKVFVGLFLATELKLLGIEMNEKLTVHNAIAKLVKPESTSYLSDEGVRAFNSYSHGGFEKLLDWFDEKPISLETFLRELTRALRDNV